MGIGEQTAGPEVLTGRLLVSGARAYRRRATVNRHGTLHDFDHVAEGLRGLADGADVDSAGLAGAAILQGQLVKLRPVVVLRGGAEVAGDCVSLHVWWCLPSRWSWSDARERCSPLVWEGRPPAASGGRPWSWYQPARSRLWGVREPLRPKRSPTDWRVMPRASPIKASEIPWPRKLSTAIRINGPWWRCASAR